MGAPASWRRCVATAPYCPSTLSPLHPPFSSSPSPPILIDASAGEARSTAAVRNRSLRSWGTVGRGPLFPAARRRVAASWPRLHLSAREVIAGASPGLGAAELFAGSVIGRRGGGAPVSGDFGFFLCCNCFILVLQQYFLSCCN
jgi:hypothetical protein